MTECERLLSEGKLSEEFLKEETRNEYVVSSEMKKVWAKELNLLKTFSEVCKEKNLRWWIAFGTLIGAIRHKGMIPWDDDIDVVMPREDYEILKCPPEWFESPISLHLPNSQECYYEGWLRIHDETTAVLYPNWETQGSVQGIYLDIFPLDNVQKDRNKELRIEKKIRFFNILGHAMSYNVNPNIILKTFAKLNRKFMFLKPEKIYDIVEKTAMRYNNYDCDEWRVKVCSQCSTEKMSYPKDWFDDTIELPFEMISVNVPSKYDEILRKTYGDYMVFPPPEKRGCWHSFKFDTERSYKKY